jgi:nucleoside-diphosphate-sugar epimerase
MTGLVAVTGATGFIGWHVARRFLEGGWRVRALVRPGSTRPVPEGVERVATPLRESAVVAACTDAQLLVHLAAAIRARSNEEFIRTNVEVTGEVARAARALGIRLVHMSSLAVTGPADPSRLPAEDDPPHPINDYAESKRQSELVVRSMAGLDWTMLRPTLVYGPRDRQFFPIFRMARHGIFPVAHAEAVYNLIHVEDVARGIEAASLAARAQGEVFFLGHPTHVSTIDMLSQMAATFGRRFRPFRVPRFALRTVAEIGSLASKAGWSMPLDRSRLQEMGARGFVCRTDKAREHLGFMARISLETGFRQTADWYSREGWL